MGHRQRRLLLLEVTRDKCSELCCSVIGEKKGSVAKNLTVSSCLFIVDNSVCLLTHSLVSLTILFLSDHSITFYSAWIKIASREVSLYYIRTLSVVSSAGLAACICVAAPP